MYIFEALNESHRSDVIRIYNYYITHGTAAFPDAPVGEEFFGHFTDRTRLLASYAVKDAQKRVVGFCLLKSYLTPLPTFRETVEVGYFLDPLYTGKGIGSIVLEKLLRDAKTLGKKNVLACISGDNEISIQFHKKHGFIECGRFEGIGNKSGARFDIVWMQRSI